MIDPPTNSARRIARADFPDAVGPQMTGSSAPAESPVEFIPGEPNDSRAAVHVMRRKGGRDERAEQRLHLVRRQWLAGFHRRFTRHGGDEEFMTRVSRGAAISAQRGQ